MILSFLFLTFPYPSRAYDCVDGHRSLARKYLAIGESYSIPRPLLLQLLNSKNYRDATVLQIKVLHQLGKPGVEGFLTNVAKRAKSFSGTWDEKSVHRLVDRASDTASFRLNSDQKQFFTKVFLLHFTRSGIPKSEWSQESLFIALQDRATQELGAALLRLYAESPAEIGDGSDQRSAAAPTEQALQQVGIEALREAVMPQVAPSYQAGFEKFLEEYRRAEPNRYQALLGQIQNALEALNRGERVGQLVRGGLVELHVGRSVYRVLIALPKEGRPARVVNAGGVKGGAQRSRRQDDFIETGLSRVGE